MDGSADSTRNEVLETTTKEEKPEKQGPFSKIPRAAIVVLLVIVVVAIGWAVTSEMGKRELKSKLVGTWYASDDTLIKVLDIKSGTMTYKLEGSYLIDMTVAIWEWRPVSADTIEVNRLNDKWTTIKIRNIDRDGFVAAPALTSADSLETWVNPF